MSRNNVRGPTSALTEFLREQGITPTTVARRAATAQEQAAAGPSNTNDENQGEDQEGEEERPSPRRRRTRSSAAADGYASDNLDEQEAEQPAPKKRKMTKAQEAKAKAAAKKKARKSKGGDDDDDFEDDGEEEEDAYTALSKSRFTNVGAPKPPAGSFETCAKCEVQFTVTVYTIAANPPPGWLCHKCAKASGTDPFKKPVVPRRRKPAGEKRTVVNFEESRFPTLANICIRIITKHIDDVEALGGIGSVNLDEISKALARNRSLTAQNAQLFYDIQNTSLKLYDATNLAPQAFTALASLNPNLTSLRLDFCGRLDDTVLRAWCTSLPALKSLELLGPFLPRVPAWLAFFAAHPQLEGFLITQSPRFDLECVKALVKECSGLTQLRLREVGKLDDAFLKVLSEGLPAGQLTYLDLADPTHSCTESALIDLLKVVGSGLHHLDMTGHAEITDAFLKEGLAKYTGRLSVLRLAHVPELTDDGVGEFFENWANDAAPEPVPEPTSAKSRPKRGKKAQEAAAAAEPVPARPNAPLTSIDLSSNPLLSTRALTALLSHSSDALTDLNINGWKGASEDALALIPTKAKDLRVLDAGWCREMTDFVMKDLMTLDRIREVRVWGCNRVSERCPRKRGVNIHGIESHTAV